MEGLASQAAGGEKTMEQEAYENLQRYRKCSDTDIDYDNKEFSDLDDCLQEECAVAVSADYIVTRNMKDFVNSKVPAILPDVFLDKLNS